MTAVDFENSLAGHYTRVLGFFFYFHVMEYYSLNCLMRAEALSEI